MKLVICTNAYRNFVFAKLTACREEPERRDMEIAALSCCGNPLSPGLHAWGGLQRLGFDGNG